MRMALVIVLLTGVAVALVHIRRTELAVRHEFQMLQTQEIALRRKLWDQQVRLGQLTSPFEVRRRAADMSLNLIDAPAAPQLADDVRRGGGSDSAGDQRQPG